VVHLVTNVLERVKTLPQDLSGLTSKPGEVQDRMSGSWEHKTRVLGSMFVIQGSQETENSLSTVTEESRFNSWHFFPA
jgi:hypothetical protein